MADVKKIKLPDNTIVNIKDYRIPGVDTVPTSGSGNVITSGGIYAANYAGSDSNGGPALKTYGIPYGAVDSNSTSTVMTATVDNFPTELTDGVCAYIRNDIIASADGWTLNVNGTGAKPVYASNADASRTTTIFSAASTYLFVYNSTRVSGGCWDIYYGYNSNDNTIGYNLRTNAATAPTKSKFYRYRLLFTSPDGQYLIPANTSTSTNATSARTTTQEKIDPFGPIWYYSTTTAVEANASVGASYLWTQYSGISLGYSFNRTGAALTLTAKRPVYIKCAPQADGSAIIDANTPFVQALPSTEDGKIYIFLGYADSATAITLYHWHPVYYYKDNAIRLWTNAADNSVTVDTELDLESENPISNGAVTQVIFDNEQVTAAALNDLRDDISTIDKVTASSLNDLNDRMLEAEDTLSEMDEYISDLGEVTSAALNDLNDRLENINIPTDLNGGNQKSIIGVVDEENHPDPFTNTYLSAYPAPEGSIMSFGNCEYTDGETEEYENMNTSFWPSSTCKFLVWQGIPNAECRIMFFESGTYYLFDNEPYYVDSSYGANSYTDYHPITITSTDLEYADEYQEGASDGTYTTRPFTSSWDGHIYLYYSGNTAPNVKIAYFGDQYYMYKGKWEYYHFPKLGIIGPYGYNPNSRYSISDFATGADVWGAIHPQVYTSLPSNRVLPNRLNRLGTITGSKTWYLADAAFMQSGGYVYDSNTANHYFWTFETGATPPTITWPSGLIWPGGLPPAILPNKHYEISVLDNIVAWMEV